MQNQIPTRYEKIESSQSDRPAWIHFTPEDREGLHFLVGLSEHHFSERSAREDAMRHARKEYAKYTGVDVEIVDEVISTLYGKSSGILDATVSGRTHSTEKASAKVSRIKAKHWYSEKYNASRNGQSRGVAYKYWVLVTVPVDEYEKVQQYFRKQEQIAQTALDENLSRSRAGIEKARNAAAAGDVIQALNLIQQEWNLLYAERKRFESGDKYHNARVGQLESAQKNLIAEIGTIRSTLFLDVGRFGTQVLAARRGSKVKVWAWVKNGNGPRPVKGLPLVIVDGSGNIFGQALTTVSGRAEFSPAGLRTGQYRVRIDGRSGNLAFLDSMIVEALSGLENRLTLTFVSTDMQGAAREGITALFDGPALTDLPARRVTIGAVNYENTRQGSSFGHALQQLIKQQLTSVSGLTVVEPRSRTAGLVTEVVKERGIDIKAADSITVLGKAAMQAAIDDADAALEVSYRVQGYEIIIEMNLKEAATDVLLGASTAVVARQTVPSGLQLIPPGTDLVVPDTRTSKGRIILDVTSHLGDGQTYQQDDVISYFVNTDKDAYLLLIYEDAAHNLIQILPNRFSGKRKYQAGNYIEVPGTRDKFEFVIKEPFGLERLWAFAATRDFPALAGRELENGLILLSERLENILHRLRTFGSNPNIDYGEAQTMITTVAGNNVLAAH